MGRAALVERSGRAPRGAPRAIAGAIAGLVVAALLAIPLLRMDGNIAAIRAQAVEQRALVERQLDVIDAQLRTTRTLLELQERGLARATEGVRTARAIERMLERLLTMTDEIRDDVDAMNRRTGGGLGP